MFSDSESESESYCDSHSTESYEESDSCPLHTECIYNLDDIENDGWHMSPRCLKSLSALALVKTGAVKQLSVQDVPADLYPALLCEACRIRCADTVSHLVSTWPYPVLSLCSLEGPLDTSGLYFTKSWGQDTLSLAEMVVRGLLNTKPECRIRSVLLPHSECEGSEMTKIFSRLPLYSLKEKSRNSLKKLIQLQPTSDFDVDEYLKEVPKFPFPVNKSRQEPILICLPGVLQWMGRHKNYRDVLVGLSLQAHIPFHFTVDGLVINNSLDLTTLNTILMMVAHPENCKKIRFSNKSQAQAMHILLRLGGLQPALQRLSGVESFRCRFEGLYMTSVEGQTGELLNRSYSVLSSWTRLTDLNLSGNLLVGRLSKLLGGLKSHLVKLNLSATGIGVEDLKFLSTSPHTNSLQYLNLDYIELNSPSVSSHVKTLLHNMRCLVQLRTCNTGLNSVHATSYAQAMSHLTSLNHWNLLQNQLGTLEELLHFVQAAAHIKSLCTLGCKPFELHAMFVGLYLHTSGPPALTEEENTQLKETAKKHNITVY